MGGLRELLARSFSEHRAAVAIETAQGAPVRYRELDERGSIAAAWMRRRGLGPGSILGLRLSRSLDHIACLLAAWRVGAAFLPFGEELPPARIAAASELAGLSLIIDDGLAGEVFAGPPDDQEPASPPADALAYVVLTSGSSGRPKAVALAHRGLPGLVEAQIAAFGLSPRSRALLFLSRGFDASLSDILTGLVSGATLIEPSESARADPALLFDEIERRALTHADLPPSMMRALAARGAPPSLELIVIGGEACDPAVVRELARRVTMINVYGPTEATICTSMAACDARTWRRPLIGRPLPGVSYQVWGPGGELVGPGGKGELVIGGEALAIGYLGMPELTARKFVQRDGRRWYRSGDVVRVYEEGELEIVGRVDRQFKLRGRLIEPAEVEAALLDQEGIAEAAVVKRSLAGSPALVAFIVASRELDERALRAALRARLPHWMLPRRFIRVAALARGARNKVAYDALRLPERLGFPRRESGEGLAGVFADVLGFGPGDEELDIFEAGCDSITLLELIAESEARGLALRVEDLNACRCLSALLARTGAEAAGRSTAWLRADAMRLSRARGEPAPRTSEGAVLMTGATGLLGARVCAELVERCRRPIVCLVRAGDDEAAQGRLAGFDPGRVKAVSGDVSRPRMGLDAERWRRLSRQVTAIVHCAAEVNVIAPYEDLRAVNLGGTAAVLELAITGAAKSLVYASTLSVLLDGEPRLSRIDESSSLDSVERVFGGYAQSKWAAEALVQETAPRIGRLCVARLGLLTGPEAKQGQLASVVRGLRALGGAPRDRRGLRFDITPLGFAARVLSALVLDERASGVYNICGPEALSADDLVRAMRSAGLAIADFEESEWRAASAPASRDVALARLAFARGRAYQGAYLFPMTGVSVGRERLGALSGGGCDGGVDQRALRSLIAAGIDEEGRDG